MGNQMDFTIKRLKMSIIKRLRKLIIRVGKLIRKYRKLKEGLDLKINTIWMRIRLSNNINLWNIYEKNAQYNFYKMIQ